MRGVALVIVAAIVQSAANLLLRGGVRRFASFSLEPEQIVRSLLGLATQPLFLSGMVLYVVSAIIWFRVVSLEDLTTAYPLLIGVSFVAVSIGAIFLYGERISSLKVFGMTLILLGVTIVGRARA